MGDWLILPEQNRVIRQDAASHDAAGLASDTDTDTSVQLEPRIMHVLVCLAARPGGVVTRNELLDTVWSQVIVREEALTHAVSQLRRTLGDDSRSARVIETIRKGGYRLLPPVQPLATDDTSTPAIGHRDDGTMPPTSQRNRLLLALAAVCAVAVGAVLILRGSDRTDGYLHHRPAGATGHLHAGQRDLSGPVARRTACWPFPTHRRAPTTMSSTSNASTAERCVR